MTLDPPGPLALWTNQYLISERLLARVGLQISTEVLNNCQLHFIDMFWKLVQVTCIQNTIYSINCKSAHLKTRCLEVLNNHWKVKKVWLRYLCWKLFQRLFYCFPASWLAKVESSQKSNGMWFFRHFFAPYLFNRSRNNRRGKLHSKSWRKKMFRKPHLKLLRWCSVRGTNKSFIEICLLTTAVFNSQPNIWVILINSNNYSLGMQKVFVSRTMHYPVMNNSLGYTIVLLMICNI